MEMVVDAPVTKAATGERAGAYIIDVLPAFAVGLVFGWIPLVGAIIAGFFLGAYWLLRDVAGASLGKMLLGLRVARTDGSEATVGQRILRNLPLSIGPSLLIIPLLGYALGPFVSLAIFVVEIVLVLTQGERMGDKLASTVVVRRRA